MGKHLLEDDPVLGSEKKRKKKSRKETLKFEDITPPSTDTSHTPVSEFENDEDYSQHHELTQISQLTNLFSPPYPILRPTSYRDRPTVRQSL
jgi:hypothetical protein